MSKPRSGKTASEEKEVQRRLKEIEKVFGEVPFVPKMLSEHPDMFLPYAEMSDRVMLKPRFMDRKSLELAAVAAGSALASEHCLAVHIRQAKADGASEGELMEAIMVGAFMASTRSQSVALRKLKEL